MHDGLWERRRRERTMRASLRNRGLCLWMGAPTARRSGAAPAPMFASDTSAWLPAARCAKQVSPPRGFPSQSQEQGPRVGCSGTAAATRSRPAAGMRPPRARPRMWPSPSAAVLAGPHSLRPASRLPKLLRRLRRSAPPARTRHGARPAWLSRPAPGLRSTRGPKGCRGRAQRPRHCASARYC